MRPLRRVNHTNSLAHKTEHDRTSSTNMQRQNVRYPIRRHMRLHRPKQQDLRRDPVLQQSPPSRLFEPRRRHTALPALPVRISVQHQRRRRMRQRRTYTWHLMATNRKLEQHGRLHRRKHARRRSGLGLPHLRLPTRRRIHYASCERDGHRYWRVGRLGRWVRQGVGGCTRRSESRAADHDEVWGLLCC
jgi:hypothetical protein